MVKNSPHKLTTEEIAELVAKYQYREVFFIELSDAELHAIKTQLEGSPTSELQQELLRLAKAEEHRRARQPKRYNENKGIVD